MISEIVDPPERLRERAQELAETIARNSPAAMAATKKALWGALELGLTDACRVGAQHLAALWGHPDQEEGPRAFAEKREPVLGTARARSRAVNLASLLTEHPFADDEPLLIGEHATLTAGEARHGRRERSPRRLVDAGVGPGRAVAVQLPNGPDAIVAMLAVWLAGAVFVPVNPRLPDAEVRAARRRPPRRSRSLDADGRRGPAPTRRATTTASRSSRGPRARPADRSRSCTRTPRTSSCSTACSAPLRGDARDDPRARRRPNLIPVSLALNAGIYNVLFGLRAGAAIVIMDGFETGDVRRAGARRFEIRSTVLPPGGDDDARRRRRRHRPRAAPVRAQHHRAAVAARRPGASPTKFGVTVLNGYGQAEIGEVIGWTAADAKEHPEKVGAVGRPHPGVDDQDRRRRRDAVDGAVGRLLVRPPSMVAATRAATTLADRIDADGFVDTGDLARIDDDGFVWIEGRARRRDQPGRQQGLPRPGRGGAAARRPGCATSRWSACPTTGSARCRSRSSSATRTDDELERAVP